jgi:hypothetical protein
MAWRLIIGNNRRRKKNSSISQIGNENIENEAAAKKIEIYRKIMA